MRIQGLRARPRRRYRTTTDSRHGLPVCPNLLARRFTVAQPNTAWVTDMTYIWTLQGWLYLAVIIDLFSRRVVGWSMSERIDRKLALDALRMALAQRHPQRGLIHHSDRGSQGEFKRPSQRLGKESCDGYAKAPFRSMRASAVEVTWPASGGTARELSAVLASDCGGPFNRGGCHRRRSVASRGWPVVPEGGRHDTVPFFAIIKAPVAPLSIVC
jgi:hypothetical protein